MFATQKEGRDVPIGVQFAAFVAVGTLGTASHYLTLVTSVWSGLQPVSASALGAGVGAFVNYFLNYHFTFAAQSVHRTSAPRFALIALASVALNTLVMALEVNVLHIRYLFAQVVATGFVLSTNFLASRYWAFRVGVQK